MNDPDAQVLTSRTSRLSVAVVSFVACLCAVAVAACGSTASESIGPLSTESTYGAELYDTNCASCHGADLGGTDRGPSHLSIVYESNHHGDDAFRSAIENGAPQHHWRFGNMPAIDGLDDADVDAIIQHIRSEQERQGFEP